MGSFAREWIERGWRTGPLTEEEWQVWESGARRCYEFASLPFPKTVVRVSSPLVGALAGPIAAYVLAELRRTGVIPSVKPVRSAVGSAVGRAATISVPAAGVPVVRGENGGNTHLLVGEGDVRFDGVEASPASIRLGVLSVGSASTAYLIHPEHGAIGFGPGNYTISRQREQADELRLVQD